MESKRVGLCDCDGYKEKQVADAEWACASLSSAGGTCPFKIYFSQLAGAELSGLARAEQRCCAVHVW